jgi:hypothetical protein
VLGPRGRGDGHAGDRRRRYAAEQYRAIVGEVPYTYANTAAELEAQLVRLVRDEAFRMPKQYRVRSYVEAWHDEAAVAVRYLDLLDERFAWRERLALKKPEHIEKPAPVTPPAPPVQVPEKKPPRTPRKRPTRTR